MLNRFFKRFLFRDRISALLRLAVLVVINICTLLASWRTNDWRLLSVLFVALVFMFSIGVRFVKDLFGFEREGLAFHYLVALLFGIGYPKIFIEDGRKIFEDEKANWVNLAGGPGFMKIQADHAVLIEPLNATPMVFLEGEHFLRPFHFIRAILPLQNLKDKISETTATTKDGISIRVEDIQFGFTVIPDDEILGERNMLLPGEKPSFNLSLIRFIYHRPISSSTEVAKEPLDTFKNAVRSVIEGVIKEYINSHQADQITAPRYQQKEPRQEIEARLLSADMQERFAQLGSKLLWVDVGDFGFGDEKAEEQWLGTWKAGWIGKAKVTQAYGEAHELANQELGRAEAQAEMLNSIIHALDDVGLSEDSDQNLRNVILVKTAQMLESMTSLYQEYDEFNEDEEKSPNKK